LIRFSLGARTDIVFLSRYFDFSSACRLKAFLFQRNAAREGGIRRHKKTQEAALKITGHYLQTDLSLLAPKARDRAFQAVCLFWNSIRLGCSWDRYPQHSLALVARREFSSSHTRFRGTTLMFKPKPSMTHQATHIKVHRARDSVLGQSSFTTG